MGDHGSEELPSVGWPRTSSRGKGTLGKPAFSAVIDHSLHSQRHQHTWPRLLYFIRAGRC